MSKFSLLLSKIVTTALGETELLIYISKTKNSHLPNGQKGNRNNKLTYILVRCTVNAQSLLSQNESDHKCTVRCTVSVQSKPRQGIDAASLGWCLVT